MAVPPLLVERDGAVAVVTLNRPEVLNALDARMLAELARAVEAYAGDEGVRAIVITGAGDRAFAAGADIRELAASSGAEARGLALSGQRVFDRIEKLGKPVIAAVNGVALGGGCELAMACTLRLAADTATLGQPEVHLGLTPGYGGTQRLARLIGKGRAMEMLLTGAPLGAAEAERIGLVNRVVPAAGLLGEARALAARLAGAAPVAVRYILSAVNEGLEMPLAEACAFEASLFGLAASTEDMREGTAAFLEKRRPVFKGR
ncbi:MAG: enoyl-CoA hydratase/isomerase family protein [Acidobacteria bacterium]|nr:enoyl-CoA hydratase/isomerase family protein [Acidobacteriota bacterium]